MSIQKFFQNWLILFIVVLGVLGTWELIRAWENVEADYKPEKKMKTIDYAQANDLSYEMPYLYVYFFIWTEDKKVNYSSGQTLNETLEDLLKSQNYFENHAHIEYIDSEQHHKEEPTHHEIAEAKAFYEPGWVWNDTFLGYFRIKLMNPEITGTLFEFQVSIDLGAMTMNSTVGVEGIWVAVHKDVTTSPRWVDLIEVHTTMARLYGSNVTATIDYDETVTQTWTGGEVHLFSTSLEHYEWYEEDESSDIVDEAEKNENDSDESEENENSYEAEWNETSLEHYEEDESRDTVDEAENENFYEAENNEDKNRDGDDYPPGCQVEINFRSNMMIEHWAEYVEYDYYDWFSWMGGIISLFSIFFFWGAYYLAIYFDDSCTMGILPEISFVFDNFECVHLLKERAGLR